MQEQKTTALTTVLSDVLANLAFMFTDDGDAEPPVGERWLEASVSYDGPVSGVLRLICTGNFAAQLAANLLGVELVESTTEEESNDAVKEFMNVICGQYVTAVYGAEDVFNLTIPVAREMPTAPVFRDSGNAEDETALLPVGGEWIKLFHTRNE